MSISAHTRAAGIILSAAALAVSAHCLAVERVETSFEISAPSFVVNLEDRRINAEQIAQAALLGQVTKHYPLIAWHADASADALARVKLSMIEESASPLPIVSLSWSASVGGEQLSLTQLPAVELYGPFDLNRETHDAASLGRVLKKTINGWFTNQHNRTIFQRSLLRNIPLVREVDVDTQTERIIMPFSLATTKMDRDSRLRVRFRSESPGGPEESGNIDVTGLIETIRDGNRIVTGGHVTEFNFSASPTVSGWSTQIPSVLAQPLETVVFVELYIYSEAPTLDGNFVQP